MLLATVFVPLWPCDLNLLLVDEDPAYLRLTGSTLQTVIDERFSAAVGEPAGGPSAWRVWTASSWGEVLECSAKPHVILCHRPPAPAIWPDDSWVADDPAEMTPTPAQAVEPSTAESSPKRSSPPVPSRATGVPVADLPAAGLPTGDAISPDATVYPEASVPPKPPSTERSESRRPAGTGRVTGRAAELAIVSGGAAGRSTDAADADHGGEDLDDSVLDAFRRLSKLFPDAALVAIATDSIRMDPRRRVRWIQSGAWRILPAGAEVGQWLEPLAEVSAHRAARRGVLAAVQSYRRTDAADSKVQWMLGENMGVSERLYSLPPLVERVGEQFDVWVDVYVSIVHTSRQRRIVNEDLDVADRLSQLAVQLRLVEAGGRDVMSIHRAATARISRTVPSQRKRVSLLQESRLLLIGLLGKMVNLYRTSPS